MFVARHVPRTTITQVAEHAQVSIKTVSRVANGEPNVRPELRQRVERAIMELGYRPSLAARTLAGRRSYLLALAYDRTGPAELLRMQDGVRAACAERGYRLLFHPCDAHGVDLAEELLALGDDPGVDGLVLAPPLSSRAALVSRLHGGRLKVALISPEDDGASVDEAAAHELTSWLVSLGHRRIGFIAGDPEHASSVQRQRGYERALREAGLPADAWLVAAGDFSFESGRAGLRALLALGAAWRPTAIVAASDDAAAGVIAEAHAAGLALPRELSVAGFGDVPLAGMLAPPLTTVRLPLSAMAARATRALLAELQGETPAAAPPPPFERIVRASVGPPP